jgi:hypothetical protein
MDLLLNENHDLVVENYDLQLVTGADLVAQRIKQRLWWFGGEWFLNVDGGLPWFGEVLTKAPDRSRVESLLLREIKGVPGVDRIESFSVDYDNSDRRLSVEFRVRTVDGEILSGEI